MSETPRTDRMVASWPLESFGEMTGLARQLERENAALREQLAERDAEVAKLARTVGLLGVERSERDAELAAIKGHAEAMHGLLIRTMPKLTPDDEADFLVEIQNAICAYRAAYPKEADK